MRPTHLLALDSGTTSCRAIAFTPDGVPVAVAQKPFAQSFPQPGWVEHDPLEIWRTQQAVLEEAAAAVGPDTIAAVGIANQRETVVLWERATGTPVAPAVVWQCRRTADTCARLKADGVEADVRARTGLLLDPYFSATKIAWLLDHVPGLRARAARGEIAAGTVDTWLLWNLTGGAVHATEPSNASRTLLLNLRTRAWDRDLCRLFDVPEAILPEVRPSDGPFGAARVGGRDIPIAGILGDQQAALFGQGCLRPGQAKSTYGTGCFLLVNAGDTVPTPGDGLLATVAWQTGDTPAYALEGSVFVAGAAVQWLRDSLGLIATAAESETLARSVPDTAGVHFVPAFTGLGAPHWRADARGMLCGLTRGATRAHVVRAALEAIAFQNRDVLRALDAGAPAPIPSLRVDGGASRNDFLMQFQADILGIPVERPAHHETTALGAARLAGARVGACDPGGGAPIERVFTPAMDPAERERICDAWRRAVAYQL